MPTYGFIHDMMDVKVLVLFVAARVSYPVTVQQLYELCYQDDCLSYFDVCTAVPELVASGHLQKAGEDGYEITPKGRSDCAVTEDSLAFTVRQRAENAVDAFNRRIYRGSFVKTQATPRENGEYSVSMGLDDERGNLMTLALMAPNQRQALRLRELLEEKAEEVYNMIMATLLDEGDQ